MQRLVASFPPSAGGLSPPEVAELLTLLTFTDRRQSQGRVGGGTPLMSPAIRRSQVQWVGSDELTEPTFSHLSTLGTVANEELGWNFAVDGPARYLQATSYSGSDQGHYDWHMDWGRGRTRFRKVSLVAHLSDPDGFVGGALEITNGSSPVRAVAQPGTVTVFPSFLLHRVTPVTRGRRLSAVCWLLGPPFA